MGLLLYTSFETKEGVEIHSVYSRIATMLCEFRGSFVDITVIQETYLSREKRVKGCDPLVVPTLQYRIIKRVPHESAWGSMPFLYETIKKALVDGGLTVEDVFEPTPEASQQSS